MGKIATDQINRIFIFSNYILKKKRECKFCENGLGHMTKVAAMPIYDKVFCRAQSPVILKHGICRIRDSSSTKFV